MNRLFIILAITLATATAALAQEKTEQADQTTENTAVELVPGMKYRNLKHIYDYKDYQPLFMSHTVPVEWEWLRSSSLVLAR